MRAIAPRGSYGPRSFTDRISKRLRDSERWATNRNRHEVTGRIEDSIGDACCSIVRCGPGRPLHGSRVGLLETGAWSAEWTLRLAVVGAAGSRVPRRNPTISPALENLFCQSPPINGRRIWQPWLGPSLCRLLKAREAQLRRWRWSILGHDRPESGRRAPGKQLKNPTSI